MCTFKISINPHTQHCAAAPLTTTNAWCAFADLHTTHSTKKKTTSQRIEASEFCIYAFLTTTHLSPGTQRGSIQIVCGLRVPDGLEFCVCSAACIESLRRRVQQTSLFIRKMLSYLSAGVPGALRNLFSPKSRMCPSALCAPMCSLSLCVLNIPAIANATARVLNSTEHAVDVAGAGVASAFADFPSKYFII